MYYGKEVYRVEGAGRVFLPAKFRMKVDEGKVIVTRGFEECLLVYPLSEWRNLESKLHSLPFTDARARYLLRWFVGNAEIVEIDKQGRIRIPRHLLDYAHLETEVLIIGLLNKIELWNPHKYKEYERMMESKVDERDLKELGI